MKPPTHKKKKKVVKAYVVTFKSGTMPTPHNYNYAYTIFGTKKDATKERDSHHPSHKSKIIPCEITYYI